MKTPLLAFLCSIALWSTLTPALGAKDLPSAKDTTVGVVNCASSLCHGSATPWKGSVIAQNEYILWSRLDKHARAYNVLLNDRSRRIAAKLGLTKPAHESKECMDCHAHNPAPATFETSHVLSDGVSCEACHGPAGRWISPHTAPDASHASNITHGLYPLDQALPRAKLCLSCHLGNTEKYVNHRTMAAGHPRLSFELNTFTSLQPAHFKVDADYRQRKAHSDDTQSWAIGQAVTVATQMELLLDPKRGRDGLFPEPTLFDCHACHHPMADQRWAPRPSQANLAAPGLIRFNAANMQMLQLLLRKTQPSLSERFMDTSRQFHAALAGQGDVVPQAKALRELAHTAAQAFAAHPWDGNSLRAVALELVDAGIQGNYPDYSAAEQASMALGSILSTLQQGGRLRNAAALNKALAQVRQTLVHDEAYKPTELAQRLQALRLLLAKP